MFPTVDWRWPLTSVTPATFIRKTNRKSDALAQTYGKKIEYSGPWYRSMTVAGDKVRLKFDHADGGLVAKGGKLTGFAIAGEDHKFVWADAVIDGNMVVVSSPGISKPVAVRYAWDINPVCNLYKDR